MAKLPDTYLWLAGSGPEEASLKALASELGLNERVRFVGWRNDMPALLAAANVFVCPSRHEPFGNVVPEAWASDVAVVSTASQGPSYMIASGESGLLVGIDRPDELAEAIRKVLGDEALARRLVTGGRNALETRFSESRIVDEYLEFFERCLKSPASRRA
jgi:glycosyltransferase involved in cell wall biosynthesis